MTDDHVDESVPQDNQEKKRRTYGRKALFVLPLALLAPVTLLIVVVVRSVFLGGFSATLPLNPPPSTTTATTTPAPDTNIDITVEPGDQPEKTVQLGVGDITFSPRISAPGDTASANLIVSNTGNSPFYLTVSSSVTDESFGPYLNMDVRDGGCDAGTVLYSGPVSDLATSPKAPIDAGTTSDLCVQMTVKYGIPNDFQNHADSLSLMFTATLLPPPVPASTGA